MAEASPVEAVVSSSCYVFVGLDDAGSVVTGTKDGSWQYGVSASVQFGFCLFLEGAVEVWYPVGYKLCLEKQDSIEISKSKDTRFAVTGIKPGANPVSLKKATVQISGRIDAGTTPLFVIKEDPRSRKDAPGVLIGTPICSELVTRADDCPASTTVESLETSSVISTPDVLSVRNMLVLHQTLSGGASISQSGRKLRITVPKKEEKPAARRLTGRRISF